MMEFNFTTDVVIGLEIHAELNTKTKLFCGCSREEKENELPNSRCCPVCLGMPGSKPVLNKRAVDYAIKLCLALKCKVSPELVFSRKSYFYPDMAKNYQISQYEIPIGNGGELKLSTGKKVGLIRAHMEEDPASLVHTGSMEKTPFVLVDYNRSGNPLIEIVTLPDMHSADEARDFMKQLITVLQYLEIFDNDKCIIKADANVSIKESGYIRSEIKNITGFKEIERALNYEIERQKHDVTEGKKLIVETRGWDSDKGITFSMRSKESEADYGYIIDPDLVVTEITKDWIKEIEKDMPELADAKLEKFLDKDGIEETTAGVLSKRKDLALLYEETSKNVDGVLAARWIRKDVMRVLNQNDKKLADSFISASKLVKLLSLIKNKKITDSTGAEILDKLVSEDIDIDDYIKKNNLLILADTGAIESVCKEAIDEAPQAVADYKAGKEKALHFIAGLVMKKTKGKAKPDIVRDKIKDLLK